MSHHASAIDPSGSSRTDATAPLLHTTALLNQQPRQPHDGFPVAGVAGDRDLCGAVQVAAAGQPPGGRHPPASERPVAVTQRSSAAIATDVPSLLKACDHAGLAPENAARSSKYAARPRALAADQLPDTPPERRTSPGLRARAALLPRRASGPDGSRNCRYDNAGRLPGLRLNPRCPAAARGIVFRKPPALRVRWGQSGSLSWRSEARLRRRRRPRRMRGADPRPPVRSHAMGTAGHRAARQLPGADA
jgi:hypothetical protein